MILLADRPWLAALVSLAAAVVALALHGLAFRLMRRSAERHGATTGRRIVGRLEWPTRLALVLVLAGLVLHGLALPERIAGTVGYILQLLGMALVGWGVVTLINVVADIVSRNYRVDVEDNLLARKRLTHIQIMRRAAIILVVLVTLGIMLMTDESVRDVGVSLFASAGVAGIVLGLAARPVFANLIAGVQIAFTQPVRIDDAVVVEGEWGWIEEINATYVVIRLWDWRRLIVPLSHFIEQPFQNWTRETAAIIGSVFWTVDYTVPVAEVRAKLEELLQQSPLWDGRVANLQVTESDHNGIVLRGLMSARNSPAAWDLRCEIREKVVTWLQQAHPDALPRLRAEVSGRSDAPQRPLSVREPPKE